MTFLDEQTRSRSTTRRCAAAAPVLENLEARTLMAAPPFAAGHTVVEMVTTYGSIWIELYDQETPQTVANFLKYVDATDNHSFKNSFIHRHEPDFVLQMGGYKLDTANNNQVGHIDTYPAVVNEVPSGDPSTWPAERRNLIRTVSMAKSPGDPNSATSEFFINLGDNTGGNGTGHNTNGLDYQNGGFTVFGYVVQGWDVVLTITNLEIVDASGGDPNSAFGKVPVTPAWDGTSQFANKDLVLLQDLRRISNPGWSQKPGANQIVHGAGKGTPSGESLFVTVNELGRPIAFYQAAGSTAWTVTDIKIQTGSPTLAGTIHAWADPKDNLFYAAAPTSTGLLLFKRSAQGFWSVRNITTEITGAANITSDITVFTTTDNYVFVGGLLANGQLALYNQTTAAPVNGDYAWTYANIVTRDLIPNGMVMPNLVGNLSSYVTSWNGLNVAGLDAAGNVQSIWWAPGLSHWNTDNLSALTGAQPFSGTLTPYVTSWGGINLAGTDADGNVVVTWWVPNNPWRTNNLTSQFSGPALRVNSLSSYVTPWGGLNIAGLDIAGKIVVYWWAPTLTDWVVTQDLVTGATQPAAHITGVATPDGTINLVAQGTNGDAMRYHWSANAPNTPWAAEDLSTTATFF